MNRQEILEEALSECFDLGKKCQRCEDQARSARQSRFWAFASLVIGTVVGFTFGDGLFLFLSLSAMQMVSYLTSNYYCSLLTKEIEQDITRLKLEHPLGNLKRKETSQADTNF